ncbi:MAG: hypothetical protein ACC645_02295 [Pirellulales bacterium]
MARLQELLPDCAILHPSLADNEADRRAAQWVLDNGGTVAAYPGSWLQQIPQEPFAVTNIDIGFSETTPKTGSVNLNGLRSIATLLWSSFLDADNELANIGKLTSLTYLDNLYYLTLAECKNISGAGLEHLSALPALRQLDVTATSIDDDALVHLKKMKGLRVLMLSETKVTATAVAELQQALPDCVIFRESTAKG